MGTCYLELIIVWNMATSLLPMHHIEPLYIINGYIQYIIIQEWFEFLQ